MTAPLQALFGSAAFSSGPFDPTSRYNGIPLATLQTPGGPIVYVTRRFLPANAQPAAPQTHTVVQGERLDTIAARYLGDATQFWRICDTNDALRPADLTAAPGTALNIPVARGIVGAQGA
jgi:nucleoid-associated protein YgaU